MVETGILKKVVPVDKNLWKRIMKSYRKEYGKMWKEYKGMGKEYKGMWKEYEVIWMYKTK